MEANRKLWNSGQQKLRRTLTAKDYKNAINQFLIQHAMVHSKRISRLGVWSFEDELWQGLNEENFRTIPPKGEHSIAWILFHIARIEDITMNMLVAGTPQVYKREKWAKKLKSTIHHSANKMDDDSVRLLSSSLDMAALREYRLSVGKRTREIVRKIQPDEFDQKVEPIRLEKLLKEGAMIEEAMEIIDYWSKRTIAGLLLMPPTRHNLLHLNEAMMLKQKLSK
ncbi:MAG TPA: DinB family protein [Anaerolineales bacterium]|nr:DinB family protein [Anaerolineales bacterium]